MVVVEELVIKGPRFKNRGRISLHEFNRKDIVLTTQKEFDSNF